MTSGPSIGLASACVDGVVKESLGGIPHARPGGSLAATPAACNVRFVVAWRATRVRTSCSSGDRHCTRCGNCGRHCAPGDVWLETSRRYANPAGHLIPPARWPTLRPEVCSRRRHQKTGAARVKERQTELEDSKRSCAALTRSNPAIPKSARPALTFHLVFARANAQKRQWSASSTIITAIPGPAGRRRHFIVVRCDIMKFLLTSSLERTEAQRRDG